MTMTTRIPRLTRLPALLAVAAIACGDSATTAPTIITATEASIAALPVLVADSGSQVCEADGYSACPFNQAVANRLENGQIAIWEPGQPVMLLTAGDSAHTLLADIPDRPYNAVIAIASSGSDRYRVLDYGPTWRAITLSVDGTVHQVDTLPDPEPLTSIGFVGSRVIRQQYSDWDSDSSGRMIVEVLERVTDTAGTTILDAPVDWLRGGTATQPPIPPMIAANPVWALTTDGELIWSPGDRMLIERRTRRGNVIWRLDGSLSVPVQPEDLEAREAALRESLSGLPLADIDFEMMRERSDTILPAVTGLTITPAGTILAAVATPLTADSIAFLRIDAAGQPTGQFKLPGDHRVVLADGDSLLVLRKLGETELREVRWLTLRPAD